MNQGEVMEQLGPMAQMRVKQIDHSPRTRVTVAADSEAMSFQPGGGKPLMIPKETISRLLNFSHVTPGMARQLQPNTLGKVVTEMLEHKGQYSLITQDGEVADIVKTNECRPLPTARLLSNVERVLPDVDYHRVNCLTPYSANLEIVGVNEKPVSKGDLVRAGISLNFSPIGVIEPSVQSYALRLVCTNGMTTTDRYAQYVYGSSGGGSGEGDGNVWNWLRHSVKDAYGSIGEIVDRYKNMMRERIAPADRAAALEALIRQAKLPTDVAQEVRARAMADPPENTYAAMNHITWAASHRLTGGLVAQAQQVVAKYADEVEHRAICPVCRHQTRRSRQN